MAARSSRGHLVLTDMIDSNKLVYTTWIIQIERQADFLS
jgi:hypothetical protein